MQPYFDPTRKTTSKKIWKTTSKKKEEKKEDDLKKIKMEDNLKKQWKTNQSTQINLIGCDTIVNSPSLLISQAKKHPGAKTSGNDVGTISRLVPLLNFQNSLNATKIH